MEKVKGIAKGGWRPSNDPKISRDTWKSDIKGIATGKKKDPFEYARGHQSAPLSTLKDPDAFGPPPKHTAFYDAEGSPLHPVTPASASHASYVTNAAQHDPPGGWGTVVPAPSKGKQGEIEEENKPAAPPVPYRTDTSGLRTDNLPKPPARRTGDGPATASSPYLPPRHTPGSAVPPRPSAGPPPVLPPRQNEHPDEHTPAPPPPYTETTHPTVEAPGVINPDAASRLGRAGVSVPGFGIGAVPTGAKSSAAPNGPQLSELQQRFARMNPTSESQGSPASTLASADAAAAAHKKPPPPPPPPKKTGLATGSRPNTSEGDHPPPLPLSSKPRPT